MKTAIKRKFDDRFSLKTFSAAVDHCIIRCPILESFEKFKVPHVGAKLVNKEAM